VTRHVCVILLNWNDSHETLACLASLRTVTYPSFQVVVVDNGSVDDSVATIRAHYPEATVLEAGSNLGFTGGNNLGLRWALEQAAAKVREFESDALQRATEDQEAIHA